MNFNPKRFIKKLLCTYFIFVVLTLILKLQYFSAKLGKYTADKKCSVELKTFNGHKCRQNRIFITHDSIPELKKLSGNLSKHVTLSCELSRLVEDR